MRWLKRAMIGVVTLIVLIAFTIWFLVGGSVAQTDGTLIVHGLHEPVQIDRDILGVPLLTSTRRDDLSYALGFVHGQERFFQMDLLRRSAAGELSALFGAAALPADRRLRIHRFRHVARQVVDRSTSVQKARLVAYTNGVNSGLQALSIKPFEYLIIGAKPKPWRQEDSFLAVFAMYLDLHDERGDGDARRGVLKDLLPPEMYDFLQAQGTHWDAALDGSLMTPPPVPDASVFDLRNMDRRIFARRQMPDADDAWHVPGSNNWAVSGARTAHGGAIIANDMHLGLRVPNIWYRASLRLTGDSNNTLMQVTGVTLPGAPFVVVGSNGYVAWGFTNSYGDWVDRVILEIDPDDASRYMTADGYRAFEVVRERIDVRDAKPEILEFESSLWGPVIDTDYAGRRHALLWSAHRPDATAGAQIAAMEIARDVTGAIEIAQRVGIPPQNIVVADSAGNIGWTLMGRIPRRGEYDGRVPVPWSDVGGAWTGWVAPDAYPSVINPDVNAIWTANARVVSGSDLAVIGDGGYALGARASQIRDNLLARDQVDVSDMLEIQLDDRALLHVPWQALLVDVLDRNEERLTAEQSSYLSLVREWKPRATVDSVGFRLVRTWRYRVIDAIEETLLAHIVDQVPDFRASLGSQVEGPVWRLLETQPEHLLNPLFVSWNDWLLELVQQSAEEFAVRGSIDLSSRTWGERNTTRIAHPLSRALPQLSGWLDMPGQPLAGAVHMPRVQSPTFGASERFAVSPGREEEAYLHMPSGQSGHPFSPYFGAGHSDWAEGRPSGFLPGTPEYRLTLIPDSDAGID